MTTTPILDCAQTAAAAGRPADWALHCKRGELACLGCPKLPEVPREFEGLVTSSEMIRPAAFLTRVPKSKAPKGSTRTWGSPDIPSDAPWASEAEQWDQSPYDGDSFWIQVNFEELPEQVRKPEWPTVGVLWVALNLTDFWQIKTFFDPRPAATIPWQHGSSTEGGRWTLGNTWCCATDTTVPALKGLESMQEFLEEWVLDHGLHQPRIPGVALDGLQVGGWTWPCQGEADDRNADFVCGMVRQAFGDFGEVAVHYTPEKGFFGYVDTH